MAGDREACLAAGMDGYVSKPLRPEELFATMDALTEPAEPGHVARPGFQGRGPEAPAPLAPSTIDLAALLAGFGGSRRLVNEVVDVFLEDAPAMLTRLRTAARTNDGAELARAAHAIKGSAGLFSQGAAYQSARHLEHLARSGDLTRVDAACADVEADMSQLMAELRHLRQAGT
jgi:HPt (histidine-containing phosphotransfer) domain-containing protein